MKKLLVITIILAVGIFAAIVYTDNQEWVLESSKLSPNETFGIYKYSYLSDGNRHAPYGTYLYLQNAKGFQSPLKGYLIFAGYCGKNMSYSWATNEHVVVNCEAGEPKNIRTLARKAYGIRITYK